MIPRTMRGITAAGTGIALAAILVACTKTTDRGDQVGQPEPEVASAGPAARPASAPATESAGAAVVPVVASAAPAPKVFDPAPYSWLAEPSLESPPAVEALEDRFAPPPGYERVQVSPGSFAEWLRRLPLAAPGTPVRRYTGSVLFPPDHPSVAAVVAIDAGKSDLQQCADSIMRMHAEWSWFRGRRDMSYRAAAGTPMPYARWARGERIVQKGMGIDWAMSSRPSGDYGSFRKYLDSVFAWANTGSLERQASKVTVDELRPGDFVILPGNPGHTVLFLDLAKRADGKRVALLGQGYMPAQGFYVLRPGSQQTWFDVDPAQGAITTPFWDPFPWSSLRRLDAEADGGT